MVIIRNCTSIRTHYWWPGQKEEEVGKGDEKNADSIDNSTTEDKTPHPSYIQSRRHGAPKRIHILGAGNLGAFVAHSLAGIPNRPPITLLLLRRQLRIWEDCGCSIEITTRGMREARQGFEAEAVRWLPENSSTPVEDSTGKEEKFLNRTVAGERQDPLPAGLTLESGNISDINAPTLEQIKTVAVDSLQQHRPSDESASDVSVSHAGEPATLQMDINAYCAQAEQEAHVVQRNEKDIVFSNQVRSPGEQEEIIYHLIVSVKDYQTVKAIEAVAHRLTRDSSILFLQNGMGIVDEVNERLFPDEKYRPTYIVGVVSHGLYSNRPFSVVHAGEGTIAMGVLPRVPKGETRQPEALYQLSTSARYIMRTMTRTAIFVAVGFYPTDILQQQLEKLAVNCIINPLTAVLDCKNGALIYNFYFTRVIRLLLAEISLVIKTLPELKSVPNVNMRFDTLRLERLVVSIANTTAENYSSMVQDIRSGRLTEIDYINGYIVRRGEEMGIHCAMNYMLMHMVKGKNKNTSQEKTNLLPLDGQRI